MAWIKTAPQEVGIYHIATRAGEEAGIRHVILHEGKHIDVGIVTGLPWGGWWWSVPIAKPPRPPVWEGDD